MTAAWELALQKIENNESDVHAFKKDIESYARSITKELLQISIALPEQPKLVCPKCRSRTLLIRDRVVKCPDTTCSWIQFRTVCGVTLSAAELQRLVNDGRTGLIKGMKSKSGKKFDAFIVMDVGCRTAFEFEGSLRKNK